MLWLLRARRALALAVECNCVHLTGQDYADLPADFANRGDNSCSCAEESIVCKVLSSALEASEPLNPQ